MNEAFLIDRQGKEVKLCECGCGEPAPIATKTYKKWGHVIGEPVRFRRGHGNRKHDFSFDVDENGCWIFRGYINTRNGYGYIGRKPAHRVYYEKHVGAIPAGLEIDHKCRNRACVNPDHLEPVTHSENALRSPLIGRWSRAEKGMKKSA